MTGPHGDAAREVVLRGPKPPPVVWVPRVGPASVLRASRLTADGWLLRVPLTDGGGRHGPAVPSGGGPGAVRVRTRDLRDEAPRGSVVSKFEFTPAPPMLTRAADGVVCVRARYRGDPHDEVYVIADRGGGRRRMYDVHVVGPYRYLRALVPGTTADTLLAIQVHVRGEDGWWSPVTGLDIEPAWFAPPTPQVSLPASPAAVCEVGVEDGPCAIRPGEALLWRGSPGVELAAVLHSTTAAGPCTYVRLRDLFPARFRAWLGGSTPPLFGGTEEVLLTAGVEEVAAAWDSCLSELARHAEAGRVDGVVVDWSDQLPDGLLRRLHDVARVRSVDLVLDSVLSLTRVPGCATTAAGRTYWSILREDDAARRVEAWLRMSPEAFHGWRPDLGCSALGVPVRSTP